MFALLAKMTGWTLAKLPEPCVQGLVAALSGAVIRLLPGKRRIMEESLARAFPEREADWIRRSARRSFAQLFETGAYALACPYFDDRRLRRVVALPEKSARLLQEALQRNGSVVLATPHYYCWEALTALKKIAPFPLPPCAAIYRPLNIEGLDRWIKRSRSANGFQLLDRRRGLRNAIRMLQKGGVVGALFDQHTRRDGQRVRFLGRDAQATRLPAALALKRGAPLIPLYCVRKSFWRYEAMAAPAIPLRDVDQGTQALNDWLASLLLKRPEEAYGWLWAHRRWKVEDAPAA